jgi:hypothetical protein
MGKEKTREPIEPAIIRGLIRPAEPEPFPTFTRFKPMMEVSYPWQISSCDFSRTPWIVSKQ